MCGTARMQTTSSNKVAAIADAAISINMMRKEDLNNCELRIHYTCGLVECMKVDFCEFSIDCADAGKYCGHPSIKYSEKMNRALIEMSEQENAMDSAAVM
jgi:hypothetical protein